jgi:molybdopterin-containing oxidoreductase family membrane subunit
MLAPHLFWFQSLRRSVPVLFVVSLIVNVGMWLERFVIVVISLSRDFLPSAWRIYSPTVWDLTHFVGSIGLFLTLLFLFIRVLPVISIFELRELVHKKQEEV